SGFASYQLVSGDRFAYGLLAAAAAHLLVAAAVWRKRELATCFWVAGTVLAFVAVDDLLYGTWLVLALTGGAIAAAVLGRILPEPRLWLASASLTALAGLYTLGELAQPGDFVHASSVPAEGVPALLLVGAALATLLFSLRRFETADEVDRLIDTSIDTAKRALVWT